MARTTGKGTPPPEAPPEPDDAQRFADSYGQQQRDRVAQLDPPPDDADLYERIAWILLNVPDVPKLGHAEVTMKSGGSYSYDYVREPEMMNAIRPLLGRAKVAAFPSIEDVTEQGGVARTVMTLKFVYADQHETIKVKIAASDTGDRAMVKTLTTGMRYLLQKQFQIATDGIDPEKENIEPDRRPAAQPPRAARARRSSGPPEGKIGPAQRGTIFAHARELFIAEDRVKLILGFASSGKVTSVNDITTNAQLDWAHKQLDAYAADPEKAEMDMAAAGVAGAAPPPADDAPPPELTPEELEALNAPDSQPEQEGQSAGVGGDEDIPFGPSIA